MVKKMSKAERKALAVEESKKRKARLEELLPTIPDSVLDGVQFGVCEGLGLGLSSVEVQKAVVFQQREAGLPAGEPVAGFWEWLRVDRAVNKGVKSIYTPCNGRLVPVFSLSQTHSTVEADGDGGNVTPVAEVKPKTKPKTDPKTKTKAKPKPRGVSKPKVMAKAGEVVSVSAPGKDRDFRVIKGGKVADIAGDGGGVSRAVEPVGFDAPLRAVSLFSFGLDK